MTTAQILFEQYKVLPPRIQQKLKSLILEDKSKAEEDDDDESGDAIRISLKALKESIEAVKLFKAGKMKTQTLDELWAEIDAEEKEVQAHEA